MQSSSQNTNQKLPQRERLKSKKKIKQLFLSGKSYTSFPVQMVYQIEHNIEKNTIQVGFSVSKRNFKHAVDRNHIKRRMSEAYRLQKQNLKNSFQKHNLVLTVMFIHKGGEKSTYKIIEEKIFILLQRLEETIEKSIDTNQEVSNNKSDNP